MDPSIFYAVHVPSPVSTHPRLSAAWRDEVLQVATRVHQQLVDLTGLTLRQLGEINGIFQGIVPAPVARQISFLVREAGVARHHFVVGTAVPSNVSQAATVAPMADLQMIKISTPISMPALSEPLASAAGASELSRAQILEALTATTRERCDFYDELSARAGKIAHEYVNWPSHCQPLTDRVRELLFLPLPLGVHQRLGISKSDLTRNLFRYSQDEVVISMARQCHEAWHLLRLLRYLPLRNLAAAKIQRAWRQAAVRT